MKKKPATNQRTRAPRKDAPAEPAAAPSATRRRR
jgi:hypothetical protein